MEHKIFIYVLWPLFGTPSATYYTTDIILYFLFRFVKSLIIMHLSLKRNKKKNKDTHCKCGKIPVIDTLLMCRIQILCVHLIFNYVAQETIFFYFLLLVNEYVNCIKNISY